MMRIWIMAAILTTAGAAAWADDAAEEAKSDDWTGSVSLGFSMTEGNSETSTHRVGLRADREMEKCEWHFQADWIYGESDDEKNVESGKLSAEHKWLLSDPWFADYMAELSYDAVASLDYRLITGPAIGRYLARTDALRLSLELGPVYVRQKQRDETDDYLAGRIAQNFEYRFNESARIWQTAEYIVRADDDEQYLLNAEVGLETALTTRIAVELLLQNRYDNQPAEDKERNDLILTSALKYAF